MFLFVREGFRRLLLELLWILAVRASQNNTLSFSLLPRCLTKQAELLIYFFVSPPLLQRWISYFCLARSGTDLGSECSFRTHPEAATAAEGAIKVMTAQKEVAREEIMKAASLTHYCISFNLSF